MQTIRFGEKLNKPIVLCLGYFGCMHKGHVELLQTAKRRASSCNASVALFTFDNNHLRVLGKDVKVLYTFSERLSIYEDLGVDFVIAATFNNEFKNLSGREFLDVIRRYDVKGIVCGFDHTCGRDRMDCYEIKNYMASTCAVDIVGEVNIDGEKVSTTLVRRLLSENRIESANNLLSQPFFAEGTVVHGRGVGNTIGFPTANISVDADKFLPKGVFAGETRIDGKTYRCIVNIGQTPTFNIEEPKVEAHVLDFSGNLYGRFLKISIISFIRDIVKFGSAEELREQLFRDKEKALSD